MWVLWPGNPVTIASSIIKQDGDNGKSGISNGIVALRFITVEAANLFKKLFHGVEIYYQNYAVDGFNEATGQDWELNRVEPRLTWYLTTLDITMADTNKTRGFRKYDLPHRDLRDRGHGNKGQHALWQTHFAAVDYECWPHERVRYLVNPYSGWAYWGANQASRDVDPYIHLPDSSYWDAMGLYHLQFDGTVRSRYLGDWINRVERQKAYEDDEYWTQTQDNERTPVLDHEVSTYQQARQRPGRAASRDVSRRPRRGRAR